MMNKRQLLQEYSNEVEEKNLTPYGVVVSAPPGTGKTGFAARTPWVADADWVNHQVFKQLAHVFGDAFWRHPECTGTLQRNMKIRNMNKFFEENPGAIILDVHVYPWTKAVVEIPVQRLNSQLEYRAKMESRPAVTIDESKNSLAKIRRLAKEANIPVFDNFRDAIDEADKTAMHFRGQYDMATFGTGVHRRTLRGTMKGWRLEGCYSGYKKGETPGQGGSTRIVWKSRDQANLYVVLKLFSDNGVFPEEPRTVKFWRTTTLRADKMKWKSAKNEFKPSQEQVIEFSAILLNLLRSFNIDGIFETYE